jgi:hypothetical protein
MVFFDPYPIFLPGFDPSLCRIRVINGVIPGVSMLPGEELVNRPEFNPMKSS